MISGGDRILDGCWKEEEIDSGDELPVGEDGPFDGKSPLDSDCIVCWEGIGDGAEPFGSLHTKFSFNICIRHQ